MATANAPVTKVILEGVRFSYANVFEPKAMEEGGTPKYSVSVIIPKSNTKAVNAAKKAIEAAKEKDKDKWGGKVPAGQNFKICLRDGDEDRPDDEAYANAYFINASSAHKPGLVDRHHQPIIDTSEFYSGCWGCVSINMYGFNKKGNKGIAAGLNNIMKVKDGESLGGAVSAEADFANVVVEDEDDDF